MISTMVIFVIFIGWILLSMVRIVPEWKRGVILRLGHCIGVKGPGLIILIPVIDRMLQVDIRTVTMDIQPQDVITLDNVSMKVNAVVYFRVVDPEMAITKVEDYSFAASQLTQTTLRSIMGQFQMDEILSQRDKINQKLQVILDEATEQWGIKVSTVEVKHIDLPKEMQRAMARQAEAERERRAKVISAEGELQRSEKLKQAADMLSQSPNSMQLAYLQSLTEIAGDKSNTIVFPLPISDVGGFLNKISNIGKQGSTQGPS